MRRNRLRSGKRTFVGCLLMVAAGVVRAGGEAPLDPRVFAGREEKESASFLVVLREQADLSAARAILEKKAKTNFVFETLRSLAARSQAGLLRRLREAGVRHRPFFVVNMIEVEGDRVLALELALLGGKSSRSRRTSHRESSGRFPCLP